MQRTARWVVLWFAAAGCSSGHAGEGKQVDPGHKLAGPPSTKQWRWPGANGRSGVNGDPDHMRSNVEGFCSWRGRPCEVAHTYTDRRNWQSMFRDTGWTFDNYAGFPGQLVISQGLVPEQDGDAKDNMAACAAGQHDADFRAFGALMVQKGRAASVVRLGWEFNGDFMHWAARSTEQWKACYRHAARAIRAANPSVVFDWTVNAHGTPSNICGGDSTHCYPGDDVVDIIGIDNYDMAPSATSREHFAKIAEAPDGLTWLYNFAKRHHKKFSVGEWGIAPGAPYNTSGENPEFIRWMHEWFSAHAGDLAYEAYFTDCSPKLVESNLVRAPSDDCARVNNAGARVYKSLWGTARPSGK